MRAVKDWAEDNMDQVHAARERYEQHSEAAL